MSQRSAQRASRPRLVVYVAAVIAGVLLLACGNDAPGNAVHISQHDGGIGPVTADFIDRALDRAEDNDATVWVFELDTPGGLVTSTDDIVQRFFAAEVPVVVFVGPSGARAASAGTFITMAAHIAAMAPGTQIGAAHPVAGGGADIEGDLGDKVTNDAAADIRGIAEVRGRNEEWAEDAVRRSISATATEAVELNVVDLVAQDLEDLLLQIDGRRVQLDPDEAPVTIRTVGLERVETNMNFFERVLNVLADPTIAFLLINFGSLLIIVEIWSPGLVGPGIFGVIALMLGFFALGPLDTNPAGIALIVLAFILFGVEIFAAGFGVFGIGGIIALILGGLLLMSDSSAPDAESVSLWVLGVVGAVVGAVILGLWLLIANDRRKRRPPPTTNERIGGKTGIVRTRLDPDGTVMVASELWSARSASGLAIPEGTEVLVVGVEGLCALVEPLAASTDAGPGDGLVRPQKAAEEGSAEAG